MFSLISFQNHHEFKVDLRNKNYVYRLSSGAVEALAYHLNRTQSEPSSDREEDYQLASNKLEERRYRVIFNQSIAL